MLCVSPPSTFEVWKRWTRNAASIMVRQICGSGFRISARGALGKASGSFTIGLRGPSACPRHAADRRPASRDTVVGSCLVAIGGVSPTGSQQRSGEESKPAKHSREPVLDQIQAHEASAGVDEWKSVVQPTGKPHGTPCSLGDYGKKEHEPCTRGVLHL